MVPRVQFCFPESADASRDQLKGNIAPSTQGKNKTHNFLEGPNILKCFVIYLNFSKNNHVAETNKQRRNNFDQKTENWQCS